MRIYIIFLILMSLSMGAFGQTLFKSIAMKNSKLLNTDDVGNVYVVLKDRSVIKYNDQGDSVGLYNNITLGPIQAIDAYNTLMVLLYYPNFNQIVLLDRLMTQQSSIDLRKKNLFQVSGIGLAIDNTILVYDITTAKLMRMNDQLNVLMQSNDLRQELEQVIAPEQILDKDSLIYLITPNIGIHVFNKMFRYLQFVPIKDIDLVQKFGNQLVYLAGDKLKIINVHTFEQTFMSIPKIDNEKIVDVKLSRNYMYVLTNKSLKMFTY